MALGYVYWGKMKIKSLFGVLLVLSLATGCTQSSQNSQRSPDSGSSGSSGSSDSSGSSGGSALDDCQAYQDGYNTIKYSDFLQFEWDAFTSGGATEFKSEEFRELWTTVQNGDFPTWDDVGYVVYELCWDAADFEIRIPVIGEEAEPAQPSVEYVEMPNLIGAAVGDVRNWLSQQGYNFRVVDWEQSPNTSQACVISGRAPVTSQKPLPGSLVENSSSVTLDIYFSCPMPTNPYPLPDSHTG